MSRGDGLGVGVESWIGRLSGHLMFELPSTYNAYAAAVTAAIVFIALSIFLQIIIKIVRRRIRSSDDGARSLRYSLLSAIDGPVMLLLIVVGVTFAGYLALREWQTDQGYSTDIALFLQRSGYVLLLAITAYMVNRLIGVILDWYREDIAPSTATTFDDQVIPSIRRLTPIAVYSIAGLWMLAALDIAISPLLATLGIGGIAIALAAQPTLANYFAGTYVISEGEIAKGDFIEIEGGPSGFVEDISWRSTKLRSRFNNLIIIPNSMMSENMITNYSRPAQAMNVIVSGGVSYSSDLQHVEDILTKAAHEIVVESEHAITETEPRVGFSVFGDSNIDFWVFLQATDRGGSFQLKSQLIKLIHQRFNEAGVVINYPMRHLVVDERGGNDKGEGETTERDVPSQIVDLIRRNGA